MPVRSENFMQYRRYRVIFHACILAVLILLGSSFGDAQSGRRVAKGSPAVATPTPTPEIVERKPPPKPDFKLKVYADIDIGGTFGFPMPERMQRWTVERLRRTTLLDVLDAGSVNRRDAIKQAKAETEAYVVLLELQSDPFSQYGTTSVRAMSIHLTVYHPASAKVKLKRTLALGQNSTRLPGSASVIQACNPGLYGNEILLLEASIEAADTVMSNFNVPLPSLCRGVGL